jgi:hypothetical protein
MYDECILRKNFTLATATNAALTEIHALRAEQRADFEAALAIYGERSFVVGMDGGKHREVFEKDREEARARVLALWDASRGEGCEMETETRLIVERIEHGIQSEIRTTIPVEQFAGAETVTMGTPGFETTYRILSAETVPVQQPESPADVLDRVTAAFWEEIKSILGAGNVKVQGWDDLLPEDRNNIRSVLRDAADELSDA